MVEHVKGVNEQFSSEAQWVCLAMPVFMTDISKKAGKKRREGKGGDVQLQRVNPALPPLFPLHSIAHHGI